MLPAPFKSKLITNLERLRDDAGASLIEYTVLTAIVAVGIIGLISAISDTIITRWTYLDSVLT